MVKQKAKVAPTSANEVLMQCRDDHNWTPVQEDLQSTGGIQRAIKAQWHALEALANYIDGVATGETDDTGKPIKATEPVKTSTDYTPKPASPVTV